MDQSTVEIRDYFTVNWQRYLDAININHLFHREMIQAFHALVSSRFHNKPFSMVDVGCGDSSTLVPLLEQTQISSYVGIDAAADVLNLARENTSTMECQKEFICDDMMNAIYQINAPVDIIYSSYAIHHLSFNQKVEFLYVCKEKLAENGLLVLIDVILAPNQSRQEWLVALGERTKLLIPDMSMEELNNRMRHPIASDYPESIATYQQIADTQQWLALEVILNQGICAFLVFEKSAQA